MISKDKQMLQIPVKKETAQYWKNLCKELKVHQEYLFVVCFSMFLTYAVENKDYKKGGKKDA